MSRENTSKINSVSFEELNTIVQNSKTFKEVAIKLGYTTGKFYVRDKIIELQISTSHFESTRLNKKSFHNQLLSIPVDRLKLIISNSFSLTEVLNKLQLRVNHNTLRKRIDDLSIDLSHFTHQRNRELLTEGKKICHICKKIKLLDEYYNSKVGLGKKSTACKNCTRARTSIYDPIKDKHRKLKRTYGITLEEYNSMLESQNSSCLICKKHPEKSHLAVDHCHTTGKIRGLLCTKCNGILGFAKDNIQILESAIEYLELSQ